MERVMREMPPSLDGRMRRLRLMWARAVLAAVEARLGLTPVRFAARTEGR